MDNLVTCNQSLDFVHEKKCDAFFSTQSKEFLFNICLRAQNISLDIVGEGFITYMRTDGLTIGEDALNDIRNMIEISFGQKSLSPQPRTFK